MGLNRFADLYRERMLQRAEWLRVYVPMITTLVIGGVMATIYASAVLYPWWRWISQVAEDPLRMM
jgi:uncharacterized protein (DUF2062 family)